MAKIFKVRNDSGSEFEVGEKKLSMAEADGYLPVVSNGEVEHRVSTTNLSKAIRDGFKPILSQASVSQVESGLRGAAQGASFGFADEITGGLESLYDIATTDKELADYSSLYQQNRDESRDAYSLAEEINPKSYLAGQVGGAIASSIALPGLSGATSVAGRAAQAALGGGLAGAGLSNEEDLSNIALDATKGATLGAGLSVVGDKLVMPALNKGASRLRNAFSNVDEYADKALGKIGRTVADVDESITDRYLKNPKAVNQALGAEDLSKLKDNLLGDMSEKASNLSSEAWETLYGQQDLIKKRDLLNLIQKEQDALYTGNSQAILSDSKRKAFSRLSALKDSVENLPENIDQMMQKNIIQDLDADIDWNSANMPGANAINNVLKSIRGNVDEGLKTVNPAYAEKMLNTEATSKAIQTVKGAFENRQNKDSYGKFLKSIKNLQNKGPVDDVTRALELVKQETGTDLADEILNSQAKEAFNKTSTNGSRKTLLGGMIGQTVGAGVGSVAGFGPQTFIGSMIGGATGAGVGAAADKYAGLAFKGLLDGKIAFSQQMIPSITQKLGRYAQPIINAAQRGNKSLAATHYLLQTTNPEYREMIRDLDEDNNE